MKYRVGSPRFALGLLVSAAVLTAACNSDKLVREFPSKPHAPSISPDQIADLNHMGPVVVDGGVNFALYSERATRVEVVLFSDPESETPSQTYEMTRYGDVWSVFVKGVGYGQHYGYSVWGPNWTYDPKWFPGSVLGFVSDVDPEGNRFNPNKLLIDPYAKIVHRDHDWSKGSAASGPTRAESTYAAAAKSVVVKSEYAWSANETSWRDNRQDPNWEGHGWEDLILYEVHAKGLSADPASGAEHPGTWSGVAEMAPYLADLGITAVELLPVHEKSLDGGYWGYWNISFFAPEITYSQTMDPLQATDEFKAMVDALHQEGIEVILDVVYNHTGEGGLWRTRRYIDDVSLDPGVDTKSVMFSPKEIANLISFRGIDNYAYYGLSEDNQEYWNNTGVGNQTRPNHKPFRRLILDSLRYYVEELHVDGFRFDLAAILGEEDLNYNVWDDPKNTVLQEIIDDPVLRKYSTRIIAEPWAAGGPYGSCIGAYPAGTEGDGVEGYYEWNPHFRHWWRSFINDDNWKLSTPQGPADGGQVMTGSEMLYGWNGRRPYHSINYVISHDGFTMYDLLSFEAKQNKCGPLNPVCCEMPASTWCETESGENDNRSRDWGQDQEPMKRQLMRNLFLAMMISHGTPMLLGGDEWMRSQYGNNNAYSTGADNEWNWFRWGEWKPSEERQRMFDFVKSVIRLRKDHAYAFAPTTYDGSAPFAWKDATNVDKTDWNNRSVMIHYYDPTKGPELAILINLERASTEFTLPQERTWRRLIDTQEYFETEGAELTLSGNADLAAPDLVDTATYVAQPSSIVVLQADAAE
jgi:isoamylase